MSDNSVERSEPPTAARLVCIFDKMPDICGLKEGEVTFIPTVAANAISATTRAYSIKSS